MSVALSEVRSDLAIKPPIKEKIMGKFLLGLSLALLPHLAIAEDKSGPSGMDPKMSEMMEKASTPRAEHKALEKYVGNWSYTNTWWMDPKAKPEESNGTAKIETIFGGRFLRQEVNGTSMGQPFEGLALTGFDNVKEIYQTLWIDNRGTAMMTGVGAIDKKDGSLAEKGSFSCPMEKSKTKTYRSVWTVPENDSFRYEFYTRDKKGVEFKMMEIVYKKTA